MRAFYSPRNLALRWFVYALLAAMLGGYVAYLVPTFNYGGFLYTYGLPASAPGSLTSTRGGVAWVFAVLALCAIPGFLVAYMLAVAARYMHPACSIVWLVLAGAASAAMLAVVLYGGVARWSANGPYAIDNPWNDDPALYCCVHWALYPGRCELSAPCAKPIDGRPELGAVGFVEQGDLRRSEWMSWLFWSQVGVLCAQAAVWGLTGIIVGAQQPPDTFSRDKSASSFVETRIPEDALVRRRQKGK